MKLFFKTDDLLKSVQSIYIRFTKRAHTFTKYADDVTHFGFGSTLVLVIVS